MLAVGLQRHGGREVLERLDLPVPAPGPGQIRIKVKAVALNHLDLWVRQGMPHLKLSYPHLLGSDVAGLVDAVGAGVDPALVGREAAISPGVSCGVCEACLSGRDNFCRQYKILGENTSGGYAEYLCVPAANLLPKPKNLSWEETAAVLLAPLTAWQMVAVRAQVKPGEWVLVHAGGSGVGSAAIQMAKLFQANVITTVGADAKIERARGLGADYVINYRQDDFLAAVKKITGKRGVDVIIDHTGAATWENNLLALAWGGRLVLCGATSGNIVSTNLTQIFFRQLQILGSTMGAKGSLFGILEHYAAGRLKPVVGKILPLAEAREAHRLLEERAVFGKVVLTP